MNEDTDVPDHYLGNLWSHCLDKGILDINNHECEAFLIEIIIIESH